MLSMASGLSVPIHNDARNRDLRLPAVSRVRLPRAQHNLPPNRLVRQEPFSHGLPGDAGMAHGGSRAVSGGERGQTPSPDLPAVPASRSMGMKSPHSSDLTFPVREMEGSSHPEPLSPNEKLAPEILRGQSAEMLHHETKRRPAYFLMYIASRSSCQRFSTGARHLAPRLGLPALRRRTCRRPGHDRAGSRR